jgi:hypothetical protein
MTTLDTQAMTSEEIQEAGLDALLERLGPVGMLRFLQQFETGQGDYTQERGAWLDKLDMETVLACIARRRAAPQSQPATEAPGSSQL